MIVPLNLPKANLKLTRRDNQIFVWCILRKKDLVLTPEEWVRQHVVHFLINFHHVPVGLIAAEFQLYYNGRSKRADIVVFSRNSEPIMIIECKAPDVVLTHKVLFQIAQYNHQLQVDLLMVTNGINHLYCQVEQSKGNLSYIENEELFFEMLQL